MRRVLFIETTHSGVGGVGSRHARLAQALPARGWNAVFGLTQGSRFHDPVRYLENLPSLDHVNLDARTGSSEGRRLAVEAAIRKVVPDVVMPGAVFDAWVVAAQMKTAREFRIVYGLPGIDLNCLAFVAQRVAVLDAGFGVSPLTVKLLRDFCALPEERTFLVSTGVEHCTRPSSTELGEPVRLLYVGRLDSDKRALDVIGLLEELMTRRLNVHLTVVGSGQFQSEIGLAAGARPDRVSLLPPMPQTSLYDAIYPEADAILLFSPREGLPNTLLEGMAHGLVPITSDFDGRRGLGLLQHGETALVFDVGDVRGAADRVQELIGAPGLKSRIGGAARRLIEEERSIESMTKEFVAVLEHAIAAPAPLHRLPPDRLEGRSRLRDVLGARMAERIRRILRRSFEFPDPSEWPLIDNIIPHDREREEARLRSVIEREDAPVTSRGGVV
jgi:glycosyltransferase involved in cell wall biosynthesis